MAILRIGLLLLRAGIQIMLVWCGVLRYIAGLGLVLTALLRWDGHLLLTLAIKCISLLTVLVRLVPPSEHPVHAH